MDESNPMNGKEKAKEVRSQVLAPNVRSKFSLTAATSFSSMARK